ncbi:MAG: ribosome biogenesis GTP-binding protein YihA/YsxC [Peptococcaceae bacterium]|nr:ribosome biogenesis GTP-binding protein YihA/YsxC [Peptococcaceae bacterium]
MIIKNSKFLIGAVSDKQYPTTGYPEIALCGRSNVGKSSLINRVIKRKNLARTSSQPGKTRQLNYYEIDTDVQPFYFVDVPGYGFAKASQKEREKWGQFIENYFQHRDACCLVLQMIDLRHPPTKDDIAMYQWLIHYGLNVQVVATKADKISRGQYQKHASVIRKGLGMAAEESIILFSAETGLGADEIHALLTQAVE